MGSAALNPRNINWLTPDPADHYIVWELLRQDPQWHWPLTYTNRVGYPIGASVALIDPNPLLVVSLKPFSSVLPEPFQYFGFEALLCCSLQFFFALRLLRLMLGANRLGIWLASLFVLTSPTLSYRLLGHYALSNQWLLLAALLIYFRAQEGSPTTIRRFVLSSALLSATAVAINPYIAFQVLLVLTAAAGSLLWHRRLTLPRAVATVAMFGAISVAVAYSLGFFISGGKGYAASGYRFYSMNLLTPLDSYGHSALFRFVPKHGPGQYEGFCYLGAGIVYLLIVVLFLMVWQRRRLTSLDQRSVLPLLICCIVLTLMALSTKITVGARTLVDLDPHEKLTPLLAVLRSSGRLFWIPYYSLLIGILTAPFFFWRRSYANLVLAIVLVVQLTDTYPALKWIHTELSNGHPRPLHSPIWSKLGTVYNNLIVLPAWQCDNTGTPGGLDGYRIFGFLATEQKMRINSYYPARYIEASQEFHCSKSIAALASRPLSPDSAYVVTPVLASVIAEGPTGPGKCHDLDGFVLCSAQSDFGLSATLKSPAERVQDAIRDPGFEDEDLSAWPSFQNVKSRLTGDQAHGGTHSLAESEEGGSVYQDISGLEPGRTYTFSAWVSGTTDGTATAQIATYDPTLDVATFSSARKPSSDWLLLSHSFTASRGGIVRIHLVRSPGTGTIYWDDVGIYSQK